MTPVSLSPFIIDQLIGAAPRYCGSSEPWRLNVPNRGIFHTTSGNIRNATTICRSASNAFSSLRKFSSFSFSGCSRGKFCSNAYFFTAEYCILYPLPLGLSGMVITPTILYPFSTSFFRLSTAKSGVPMKTIRKSFLSIYF